MELQPRESLEWKCKGDIWHIGQDLLTLGFHLETGPSGHNQKVEFHSTTVEAAGMATERTTRRLPIASRRVSARDLSFPSA
jgi:hypothetical protein